MRMAASADSRCAPACVLLHCEPWRLAYRVIELQMTYWVLIIMLNMNQLKLLVGSVWGLLCNAFRTCLLCCGWCGCGR